MRRIRSSRRRRTMVAAFLPYLLLSLFVDLVHLHPLLNRTTTEVSIGQHVGRCTETTPKAPQAPCAICQWQRASTAVKASVPVGAVIARLPDAVPLRVASPRGSPALLVIDPRGPPASYPG